MSGRSIKKSISKNAKPVAEAVVVEPSPVIVGTTVEILEEPEIFEDNPDEPELSLNDKVKKMLETISALMKTLKLMETDLKNVRVLYRKEIKENNKRNKQKKPRKTGNSEPHGFVKEVKISDDLADFLKLPRGSKMARPKVTKAISQYVKDHDLSLPSNKTMFKADRALKKILGEVRYPINKKKPELGDGYSYFNLQTHLVNHFIKEPATLTAA